MILSQRRHAREAHEVARNSFCDSQKKYMYMMR